MASASTTTITIGCILPPCHNQTETRPVLSRLKSRGPASGERLHGGLPRGFVPVCSLHSTAEIICPLPPPPAPSQCCHGDHGVVSFFRARSPDYTSRPIMTFAPTEKAGAARHRGGLATEPAPAFHASLCHSPCRRLRPASSPRSNRSLRDVSEFLANAKIRLAVPLIARTAFNIACQTASVSR
jgi:hypothetical protein